MKFKHFFISLSLLATTLSANAKDPSSNELYIMNWSDYIAPDTIANFEKETNIKVHYDLIDSNEMLEAKLMAGNSGYDIVVPSIHVLKRLSDVGLLHPLDKSKMPNWKNLDKDKMAVIAKIDKDNTYGIPYTELSTGIGVNEKAVRKYLGEDADLNTWDLVFDKDTISKIGCGVTMLDSASDMLCSALIYLNLDPESTDKNDYEKAGKLLASTMPFVSYLHSSQYMNDLAAGEICVAVGWSSDIQIAAQRSKESGLDDISYIIPKEGALMGYDMMAIPKDAKNIENAYKFLDYIMRPDVMASISNYVLCANANAASTELIDKAIRDNPGIYYPKEQLTRMHIVIPPNKVERIMTKTWNKVRTSSN